MIWEWRRRSPTTQPGRGRAAPRRPGARAFRAYIQDMIARIRATGEGPELAGTLFGATPPSPDRRGTGRHLPGHPVRRQRDHDEPARQRLPRPAAQPGPVGPPGGRPGAGPRRGGRGDALRLAAPLPAAGGARRLRDRRREDRGRRDGDPADGRRQPGSRDLPRPGHWTSPGRTGPTTCRSRSGRTSASAPRWPGWRARSSSHNGRPVPDARV